MALSAVFAVVSSSWLLRTAAFQKAPFKMTFAGSNSLSHAISRCARTADNSAICRGETGRPLVYNGLNLARKSAAAIAFAHKAATARA
jgi:hypothetical protein